MDPNAIPIIQISIENLKHHIQCHLGTQGSKLGEGIDAAIDKAVAEYDFDGAVKAITHKAIEDQLERYFSMLGPGGRAIRELIESAFRPEEVEKK